MKVVIAGGTGFLGGALTQSLSADGHDVVVLSRKAGGSGSGRRVAWTPGAGLGDWAREIDGADAVINLAGAGIADKRWSATRKKELLDSRVTATRTLVSAIGAARTRPQVFLSASGAGFYGTSDTQTFDESSPAGDDFLAHLCVAWESEAVKAQAHRCRVVILRTGIVLSRNGGALKKMLLPFQMGAGGPIASGRQIMSWIHLDDWVGIVRWTMTTASMQGPVNLTTPAPVTNAEFTRALGRALHRPAFMPMPGFILRVLVGEMSDVALVRGQRVIPKKAVDGGFMFRHVTIDDAMKAAVA